MNFRHIFFRSIFFIPSMFLSVFRLAFNFSRDLYNKVRFLGCTLDYNVFVNKDSILHKNSRVLSNSILNNVELGSFSYIGKDSVIQNCKIGKYCSLAQGVMIGLGSHPIHFVSTSPIIYKSKNTFRISLIENDTYEHEYKFTKIGNDVWIGTRAIIMDGISVSQGAVIAAGSIVTKDVPPYAIVAGVPAKIIKYRFDNDVINELLNINYDIISPEDLISLNKKFHAKYCV